jgi:hypothetical protein
MKSALLKATVLSAGVASSLTLASLQPAQAAGFSGDYAPTYWGIETEWLQIGSGASTCPIPTVGGLPNADCGGVDERFAADKVYIVGSNVFAHNTSGRPAIGQAGSYTSGTFYQTVLPGSLPSFVSFNWNYGSYDSPEFDFFGVVINNVQTILADTSGQFGSYTFQVNPGDEFGFGVWSADSSYGAGYVEISNFNVTPVPTPALLPGLIGMGVAALRKKQGETEEADA